MLVQVNNIPSRRTPSASGSALNRKGAALQLLRRSPCSRMERNRAHCSRQSTSSLYPVCLRRNTRRQISRVPERLYRETSSEQTDNARTSEDEHIGSGKGKRGLVFYSKQRMFGFFWVVCDRKLHSDTEFSMPIFVVDYTWYTRVSAPPEKQ